MGVNRITFGYFLRSLWINGYCINGPADPDERILIESIRVRAIPARLETFILKHMTNLGKRLYSSIFFFLLQNFLKMHKYLINFYVFKE